MDISCSICGMVLANDDSNYPSWCKVVRAICWVQGGPILSDEGSVDDTDVYPFNLSIPSSGFHRFDSHRNPGKDNHEDLCYPFHSICWTLFLETVNCPLECTINTLFQIFESIHDWCFALRWGHNYHLEDMLHRNNDTKENIINDYRADKSILADPSNFAYLDRPDLEPVNTPSTSRKTSSRLGSLPPEILQCILCNLHYQDLQRLLRVLHVNIPSLFWLSRFWHCGETGFARSILPKPQSSKRLFLAIITNLASGPEMMNLQNRKRIWELGANLNRLILSLNSPGRMLTGAIATDQIDQVGGPTVSCLALREDAEGCQELKQIYLPLSDGIYALSPLYNFILQRRVITGLQISYKDNHSISGGYCNNQQLSIVDINHAPQFLWLLASSQGFEVLSFDYPKQFIDASSDSKGFALARWDLKGIEGLFLGLDFIRVVRICLPAPERELVSHIYWSLPYPISTPSIYQSYLSTLFTKQRGSFAPASFLVVNPTYGRLIAIKVYSPLGRYAGITGIGFVYNNSVETIWGPISDSAASVFFLGELEQITKVTVYSKKSVACHLQLTTTTRRTSKPLPPFPKYPDLSFDRVNYEALDGDVINGFCGCFKASSAELYCFGVMSRSAAISSMSMWITSVKCSVPRLFDMPFAWYRNHGHNASNLKLQGHWHSVQASVNKVSSKYRRVGQVTGLLVFLTRDDAYPQLLGQFSGFGERYNMGKDEKILDIQITTTHPLASPRVITGLSQAQDLILVTNRRKIHWGHVGSESIPTEVITLSNKAEEVFWDFNAIFDRLRYIYVE